MSIIRKIIFEFAENIRPIHLLILQWLNIAAVADSSDTNSSG